MRIPTLICLFMIAMDCNFCAARIVPVLTYDQLLEKADVVVIVRPGKTRDAVKDDPVIAINHEPGKQYLTAVVTPMKVLATIKGRVEKDSLLLPHYRRDWEKAKKNGVDTIVNGPGLVTFKQRDGIPVELEDLPMDREYLLFLVKRPGVGYDFVTGQFDPDCSVFRLSPADDR